MNTGQHLWAWLSGKKTYLISFAGIFYTWGITHNLWPHDLFFDSVFVGGIAGALRHGWKTEAAKILTAVMTDPPQLPALPEVTQRRGDAESTNPTTDPKAPAVSVVKTLGIVALAVGLWGCGGSKLELGGAYSPAVTGMVDGTNVLTATQAPDMAFYVVDLGYKTAWSAVDAVFNFERDNRAMLWSLSPQIKRTLDQIRPQAVAADKEYLAARRAYVANPTPAGLGTVQAVLAKMQQLLGAAQGALPKAVTPATPPAGNPVGEFRWIVPWVMETSFFTPVNANN